jgi:hypothetical protein
LARKTTTSTPVKAEPALLAKPREEVRAQLIARVDAVKEILDTQVQSEQALEGVRSAYNRWNDFNFEFLRRAFTTVEYADEYNWYGVGVVAIGRQSLGTQVEELTKKIIQKRNRLISLIERLDLIDEQFGLSVQLAAEPASRPVATASTNKVFLVHGQDDAAKATVARFISRCGLEPIYFTNRQTAVAR